MALSASQRPDAQPVSRLKFKSSAPEVLPFFLMLPMLTLMESSFWSWGCGFLVVESWNCGTAGGTLEGLLTTFGAALAFALVFGKVFGTVCSPVLPREALVESPVEYCFSSWGRPTGASSSDWDSSATSSMVGPASPVDAAEPTPASGIWNQQYIYHCIHLCRKLETNYVYITYKLTNRMNHTITVVWTITLTYEIVTV